MTRAAADRSFEELYRGHHEDVLRAALRELGNVHDAEDVAQAAFVDAYRAVLRGSEPQSPRAWLLAIAENVRRRRFRTAQRRPREYPTDADFPLTAELPYELAGSLTEALGELPDDQRRAFVLRELGGLSYDEIARETGSTVGAVQMQLFRARRALRERLDPPQVLRRRRAGLVLPLPGWLTTLFTRSDVSVLTPRAAGAVGATVLAVAGTTVAVKDVGAGPPPASERRVAVAPAPPPAFSAVRLVASRPERASAPRPVARTVQPSGAKAKRAPARPAARPARTQPVAAATPAGPAVAVTPRPVEVQAEPARPSASPSAPIAVAAETVAGELGGTVVTVARKATEGVRSALEPPRLPAGGLRGVAGTVLESPGLPPLPSPVPEAVTGAVGAAGDGALPLPVPGVPPLTPPPAP